jgi:hypothetical protein
MAKITVKGTEIVFYKKEQEEYISLTDIAKIRDKENSSQIISLWLRTYSTIEYLGLWEMLNNPDFKPHIYEGFKNEADVLNVALFGITAKEWRESNHRLKGNIRDYAAINELICLSNMENLNAVFINEGLSQQERLIKLNLIAIQQMKILQEVENRKLLK